MSNPAAAAAEEHNSEKTVTTNLAAVSPISAASTDTIECVFCSKLFPSYSSLQDHFELSHNVMDPETNTIAAPNIKCFLCPTEFDTFETAGKHYVFMHKLFHTVKKRKEDKVQNKENVEEKKSLQKDHNMGDSAKEQQQVSNSDSKKQPISPQQRVMYKCVSCAFISANMDDVRYHVNSVHFAAAQQQQQQHSNSDKSSGEAEIGAGGAIPTSSGSSNIKKTKLQKTVEGIKPTSVVYKCKTCPFTASNAEDVKVHWKAKHSIKASSIGKRPLMPSPDNSQPVPSTSSSSSDANNSNPKTKYKCGLCPLRFLTVEDARVHWNASHQAPTVTPSPKKQDKRKQNLRVTKNCQLCKFTCTSTKDMNEHLMDMHMFLSCSECQSLCPDAKALVDHAVMVHKDKQASADVEMEQDMDMEDVAATTTTTTTTAEATTTAATAGPSNITENHSSISTENKTTTQQQLRCTHCGIRFYSQQGLQIHAKIAHNSTPTKRKEVTSEEENDHWTAAAEPFAQDDDDDDTLSPKIKKTKIRQKVNSIDGSAAKKPKAIRIRGEAEKCGICKETVFDLLEHFFWEHEEEVKNRKFRQNQCLLCKEIYPSVNHLKDHLVQEHDGKRIKLEEIKIQQQQQQNHERGTSLKTLSSRTCRICSELFVTRKEMFDHCRTNHPGEAVERCPTCNKGFNRPYQLYSHMEIHQPDYKPHQCPQCPAVVSTRRNLSRHFKQHHTEEGQRLKSCNLCDKTFRWTLALNRHKKVVHATVAAFHCDQCPKTFKSKEYLKNHMTACHDAEEPKKKKQQKQQPDHSEKGEKKKNKKQQQPNNDSHLCFLCGYNCSSRASWRGHMKRHEEGKMMGFPRKQRVSKGGVTKYGQKPLACGVGECKKRFRKEFRRERHWKVDHGIGDWVRKNSRYRAATAAVGTKKKGRHAATAAVAMKEEEEYEEESEEEESD